MRALGQDPTEQELEAMVEDVDEDGSGSIEVDEFIMMMAKRSKGTRLDNKLIAKIHFQLQLQWFVAFVSFVSRLVAATLSLSDKRTG